MFRRTFKAMKSTITWLDDMLDWYKTELFILLLGGIIVVAVMAWFA